MISPFEVMDLGALERTQYPMQTLQLGAGPSAGMLVAYGRAYWVLGVVSLVGAYAAYRFSPKQLGVGRFGLAAATAVAIPFGWIQWQQKRQHDATVKGMHDIQACRSAYCKQHPKDCTHTSSGEYYFTGPFRERNMELVDRIDACRAAA